MHDVKRQFIRCLASAQQAVMDDNHENFGYLTYLTSSGIVVGKQVKIDFLKVDEEGSFQKDFEERLDRKEPISIYQLGLGALDQMLHNSIHEYDTENTDTKAIVLEDVTIRDFNNLVYNLETFVLFSDQVTGIFPGKITFDE